jgi:Tfp pilus assembly protein PilX
MLTMAHRPRLDTRRGAATLIVVMVLFFIVSLVAAYASRNLIFEQKTASNQMRSSQAFEAAEAGVEWALSQLNTGRATAACVPSTTLTDQVLRERYLNIDATTGSIAARTASGGGSVQPSCVFDTSSADPNDWRWSCRCPAIDAASAALTGPATTTPAPAFSLRFCSAETASVSNCLSASVRSGVIRVDANGCTRLDANCLAFGAAQARGAAAEGASTVSAVIALRSALVSPPAAALTVRDDLGVDGGTTLALGNGDAESGGLVLHAGGNIPSLSDLTVSSLPGTPGSRALLDNDPSLKPAAVSALGLSAQDRFFIAFFGMRPDTYRRQPATVQIDCSIVACDAAGVNTVLNVNPGRIIWLRNVTAGFTLDADVGSATQPAVVVVEGDVNATGTATFTGLLYGRRSGWDWDVGGNTTIVGAVVAQDDMDVDGGGTLTINYDRAVLTRLRTTYGSFVRVPGGWRDFTGI